MNTSRITIKNGPTSSPVKFGELLKQRYFSASLTSDGSKGFFYTTQYGPGKQQLYAANSLNRFSDDLDYYSFYNVEYLDAEITFTPMKEQGE